MSFIVGRGTSIMQPLGVHGRARFAIACGRLQRWSRHVHPTGPRQRLPPTRSRQSTIRNRGLTSPALGTRSSRTTRHASLGLAHPCFLTANSTFWPSSRTPSTTRSTIAVAFRSSRTRTTVAVEKSSGTIGFLGQRSGCVPGHPNRLFTLRQHPASPYPCRRHRQRTGGRSAPGAPDAVFGSRQE